MLNYRHLHYFWVVTKEGGFARAAERLDMAVQTISAQVRELEKSLHMVAGPNAWKIGIIVDADRMMPQAENAFLKTLEEPPPRTLLLLLSGRPGALLPTVISRCVRMPLVGQPDLTGEGGEELIEALNMAASAGLGSPAVALGLKSVFSLILRTNLPCRLQKTRDDLRMRFPWLWWSPRGSAHW